MGFFGNSASLAKIDGDLAAVAEGSADLSYQVGTTGSDAPGRISSNINRFSPGCAVSFRMRASVVSVLPPTPHG